jgi:hypothetical protein
MAAMAALGAPPDAVVVVDDEEPDVVVVDFGAVHTLVPALSVASNLLLVLDP